MFKVCYVSSVIICILLLQEMDAFCNVAALNGEWREIAFYLEMSRQMKTTVHIKEFGG